MTSSVSASLVSLLTRVQQMPSSPGTWYLVGGFLRDQLMGRVPLGRNIDLAVPRGAIDASRALASHLGGAFVLLDAQEGTARVVVSHEGERFELDVSDFRGPTIEQDLSRRDFTVNAMAVPLADWLRSPESPRPLLDPLNGQEALRQRRLLACFPGTFTEDPIRILRAFRFAAQFGFAIDPAMEPLLRAAAPSLTRTSGERQRDELLAICSTDHTSGAVHGLDKIGALEVLIPELGAGRGMDQGNFHHLDVLGHQLETVVQADRILLDFAEFSERLRAPLVSYTAEEFVERRSRKSLIKLSGLLHDVGKPTSRQLHPDGDIWFIGHEHTGADLAVGIVERLKLSNRESTMVIQMVRHHLRPGFLSREPELTRRALYRFYKDLGDDGPACLLTWWSDRMATRGTLSRTAESEINQQRQRLEAMFEPYFFQPQDVIKPVRTIDGTRIMQEFHLAPGRVVGELLALIEEAQAEGRVRSAEDALDLARDHLRQHPPA